MSAVLGTALGATTAAGLLLAISGTPRARRITLDDLLAPYMRDAPRPSRLIARSGPRPLVPGPLRCPDRRDVLGRRFTREALTHYPRAAQARRAPHTDRRALASLTASARSAPFRRGGQVAARQGRYASRRCFTSRMVMISSPIRYKIR
jgi:hypothetical protein